MASVAASGQVVALTGTFASRSGDRTGRADPVGFGHRLRRRVRRPQGLRRLLGIRQPGATPQAVLLSGVRRPYVGSGDPARPHCFHRARALPRPHGSRKHRVRRLRGSEQAQQPRSSAHRLLSCTSAPPEAPRYSKRGPDFAWTQERAALEAFASHWWVVSYRSSRSSLLVPPELPYHGPALTLTPAVSASPADHTAPPRISKSPHQLARHCTTSRTARTRSTFGGDPLPWRSCIAW